MCVYLFLCVCIFIHVYICVYVCIVYVCLCTRPGTALAKPVDGASSWTVFPASEGAAGDFE